MKIYEITDLKELLNGGDKTQIEEVTVNIVKTVRALIVDSHFYIKEFGLLLNFEIDKSISETFEVKENETKTVLINPKNLVYKEDETLNTFSDLKAPLTKTITELLVKSLDTEMPKSSTPIELKQNIWYGELFVLDGRSEIKSSLMKKFNQQSDHLKYHFLVGLFDRFEFNKDSKERFSKLDQLLDEGVFPMEAIVDFMKVCHYPKNNPLPVPNNLFRNKKTENGITQVEVEPILRILADYSMIQQVFKNEI